jgi:hypothetical protein
MFSGQENSEMRCDVVARARAHGEESKGKEGRPYKRIVKTFKLEGDFIVLELRRDAFTDGWWVSAVMEPTDDKKGGYGSEYFSEYSEALNCFKKIEEKYGLETSNGSDFGSD